MRRCCCSARARSAPRRSASWRWRSRSRWNCSARRRSASMRACARARSMRPRSCAWRRPTSRSSRRWTRAGCGPAGCGRDCAGRSTRWRGGALPAACRGAVVGVRPAGRGAWRDSRAAACAGGRAAVGVDVSGPDWTRTRASRRGSSRRVAPWRCTTVAGRLAGAAGRSAACPRLAALRRGPAWPCACGGRCAGPARCGRCALRSGVAARRRSASSPSRRVVSTLRGWLRSSGRASRPPRPRSWARAGRVATAIASATARRNARERDWFMARPLPTDRAGVGTVLGQPA
ncbi:hypothetical protein L599_000500000090 [Luteimonas sp. J16]|nr:hypothetical protein L599_000500000090 [Luteimonas sp. J16]